MKGPFPRWGRKLCINTLTAQYEQINTSPRIANMMPLKVV
jgi:hypothetical protein